MSKTPPQPPSSKPQVLVVDDSKLVRFSIRKVLKKEFELLEAVDGEQGWEMLVENDGVRVVITDNGMPKLDGYDLIKRIREFDNRRVSETPIMMVTGAEEESMRQKALELGATDFVTKPFDDAQLLARVRTHAKLDETKRSLKSANETLAQEAATDPLTGASSQRYFDQRGQQDFSLSQRHDEDLTLVHIEIDQLNTVEEQYDNQALEHILICVAQLLQAGVRKEDTVARISKGSFAIIAPRASIQEALTFCNRVRLKVSKQEWPDQAPPFPVTISVGLSSLFEDKTTSFQELHNIAQRCAQKAKAAGGNRIFAISKQSASKSTKKISLDAALKALEAGHQAKLRDHVFELLDRMMPLLDFCESNLDNDIKAYLNAIRRGINNSLEEKEEKANS